MTPPSRPRPSENARRASPITPAKRKALTIVAVLLVASAAFFLLGPLRLPLIPKLVAAATDLIAAAVIGLLLWQSRSKS